MHKPGLPEVIGAFKHLPQDDPMLQHLTLSKATSLSSDYSKLRASG